MKRRARGWFEKTHVRVPNFDLEFAWNLRRQKGTTEKYPATTFLKARAATFGQPHYGGVHAVPCQSQRHRSADAQPPLRLWPPPSVSGDNASNSADSQKLPFDRQPPSTGITPSQALIPSATKLPEATAIPI